MRVRGKPWWIFVAGNLTGALLVAGLFVAGPFAPPDALEPGELVILSGKDDSRGGRQVLIDLWNDSHPGNRARIDELPEAADGQYAQMYNRTEDDTTDIYNLDVTWTAAFADPSSGPARIRAIDESALAADPGDSFMPNPLQTCRYDGKLWALPFNSDAGLLYYRSEKAQAGPFTWAGIARAPDREAAYTTQLQQYEGLTVNILEAVWSLGGDLDVDEHTGQVTLDLAIWDEAARRLTPRRDGKRSVVLGDSTTFTEGTSRDAFRDGRVPFMRNWPVAYRIMAGGDASPTETPVEPTWFKVAQLPGASVLGGQNLAISARTKQPRAAQALIEFLTSEHSQRILFEKGGFAATRDAVYNDETVKQNYRYAPTLHAAITTARLRPRSANYVTFSKTLAALVHDVLVGRTQQLPRNLAAQLTQALQGKQAN
ncbi:extracellular solute-binding protein [Actinoplanes sp. TFC3]|uniref:extracellular solute-binding protein n=1 Tax=Actinoplanes sp. TFC3 TaxID=1710355 RepID=UPI000AEA7F5F|nr:extracellular solute-binding protein [Actinoplanes sp. TFC3]